MANLTEAYRDKYKEMVMRRAQQETMRIDNAITIDVQTGETEYFNRVAPIALTGHQTDPDRGSATQWRDRTHDVRRSTMEYLYDATKIDKRDYNFVVGGKIDPVYIKDMAAWMNRQKAYKALNLAGGTVYEGRATASGVALPSANKVLSSIGTTTTFNLAKLRAAGKFLNGNNVGRNDRYLIGTAELEDQLFAIDEIASQDYNREKPLVNGMVPYFFGFNIIIVDSDLIADESGEHVAYFWQKEYVKLTVGGSGMDGFGIEVDRLPESKYDTGIFIDCLLGGARLGEEGVGKIYFT